MIDPLRSFSLYARGLGYELAINYLMPVDYETGTRVIIMKSTSVITSTMVSNYITTFAIPDNTTVEMYDYNDSPISDGDVLNGTEYYYAAFVATIDETSFTDCSTAEYANETPKGTFTTRVVDAGSLIMRMMEERYIKDMGLELVKDVYLKWSFNLIDGPYPCITIGRGNKMVLQEFLGRHLNDYKKAVSSGAFEHHSVEGQIEQDVVSMKFLTEFPEQRTNLILAFRGIEMSLHNSLALASTNIVHSRIEFLGDSEMPTDNDTIIYMHEILISIIHIYSTDITTNEHETETTTSLEVS